MSILGILTGILANNIFHCIWFSCLVPEPKHNKKKTGSIVIGTSILYTVVALAICVASFQILPVPVGIFLGYLAELLLYGLMYCFLLSASHPVKSLFLFTEYCSIHTIIIIIVSVVVNVYTLGNPVVWILRALLNVAVLIPYLLFFREKLFRMYREIRSSYGIISFISIMCYLIQSLFWFYNMRMGKRELFFDVLLLVSCGFTIAVYVVLFRYMAQSDRINRIKQLQANEKFLQAQIDSYKKIGENAKQTRHDFRHHSIVLTEYAKNQDYKGILSYLEEYNEKERKKYQLAFCKNHAADTVLAAYASRCEQNGIEISADVWLEETEGVSDYDLVTILANILENAVNGCMETEGKRRMEITVGSKGSKLVIVCKNTCADDILFENGLPKNKEREGIGVESILSTASKYGGVVDFFAAEGTFVCQVILGNRSKGLHNA
ncbi:MAG: GHKL domain-containing protein [Lachnospiraceae bacterium]|nr:GHKL domain-containing protein [Lachnospiraceae bacterium]